MGDISIRGKSPILRQSFAVGGAVRRLGRGLRARKGRGKDFKTHGRDVPTMAAEGGRIGLKHGTKPWGTGPKPGSHEFLQHHLHKPRKGKAIGSIVKGGKKIVKKIIDKIKKKKRHESLDVPGSPGPQIGKYPGIDKAMKNIKKSGDIWGPGKAAGGRIGKKHGFQVLGGGVEGKPHSTREGRDAAGRRRFKRWTGEDWSKGPKGKYQKPQPGRPQSERIHPKGKYQRPQPGRPQSKPQPLKKGGKADKNWIQKAVDPKHKGYCTPMTKKTCTPARKALARTFKKKAKTGW